MKVPFPGIGNYVCKTSRKKNQDVASDTYTSSHPDDNWTGDMLFNDVVKQFPKTWLPKEHIGLVDVTMLAVHIWKRWIHIWKRWIQVVACVSTVYHLLITQRQKILQIQ